MQHSRSFDILKCERLAFAARCKEIEDYFVCHNLVRNCLSVSYRSSYSSFGNATAMTYCCTSSLANTGTLNSYPNSGDIASGRMWSTAQGPTGKFWTVSAEAGTAGGSPSQPAQFYFTLEDYSSGVNTSVASCGDAKNDWGVTSNLFYVCSMSAYLSGSMDISWQFLNLDTSYSRVYEFQGIAYYH